MCVIFTWASAAKKQEAKLVMSVFAQRPAASIRQWEQQLCWPSSNSPSSFPPLSFYNLLWTDDYAAFQHKHASTDFWMWEFDVCVLCCCKESSQEPTSTTLSTAEACLHLSSIWSWISGSLFLSSVSYTVNIRTAFIIKEMFVLKNPDVKRDGSASACMKTPCCPEIFLQFDMILNV